MNKKIFFKIGTPLIAIMPLVTMVGCSTSWTHWKTHKKQDNKKFEFVNEKIKAAPSHFTDKSLLTFFANENSNSPNVLLDKVNNIYSNNGETLSVDPKLMLISLLGNKMRMINDKQHFIGDLWKKSSWPEFKNYLIGGQNSPLKGINSTLESLKFNYKGHNSVSIPLNLNAPEKGLTDQKESNLQTQNQNPPIGTPVSNSPHGLLQFMADHLTNSKKQTQVFDLEGKLSDNPQLNVLVTTAPIAMNYGLLNSKIVKSLLSANSEMSLGLAYLVNLPIQTFKGFVVLLNRLSNFFNQLIADPVFKSWAKDNEVDDLGNLQGLFLSKCLAEYK